MNPFVSEHSITLLQQLLPAIQASPFDKTDAYRICVISAIICETGYRQLSWSPELAESLADIRNLLKFHDGSDTCSPWNRLIEESRKQRLVCSMVYQTLSQETGRTVAGKDSHTDAFS